MRKSATAVVSLALVAFLSPSALAGPSIETGSAMSSSIVHAAVPPADPDASGAIIRDASCFANQLGGGEPWASVSAERVDLPFTMQANGEYWNDIWISPQGALSHDEGGILAVGFDADDQDLIRASEVYAPMLGGSSVWGWWNEEDYTSPDFGQHLSPVYYGFTTFGGSQALCVTWLDMVPRVAVGSPEWVDNWGFGYWTQASDWDASRRNSFQVLLVDRSATGAGNFDIVYNYDTIQWQAEYSSIDSSTGALLSPAYTEAGWSLGVPSYDSSHMWRGYVDGRRTPEGVLNADPQLPYPQDHWWSQHDDPHGTLSGRETYLDSSPTGLAVTRTNSSQVGRHVFPIRGPRWHLALVIDGRASLTPEEYAAEVDAIVAGLDDDDAFPRDGRFGVSVTAVGRYLDPVTYEYVDAVMVIPEMTIFSDATMATLQAWIRTIPQATTAGGRDVAGLTTAVSDSESFLSRNALRSVCQVSFAQPSSALRTGLPALGLAGVDGESASVDRVDLVGIGGHVGGSTGSTAGEEEVDDLLFGGNGYLFTPSTASLAEDWVAHCAERLPLIRGIEVTQGIQNLDNDVPLVANRDTIVRVYAEKTFADDPNPYLTGGLIARRAGYPYTSLDGAAHSLRIPTMSLGTTTMAPAFRNNTHGNRVLEFRLPEGWTTGDVVLTLETNQSPNHGSIRGVTCMWGQTAEAGHCELEARYTASPPLTLDLYIFSMGGQSPTDAEVAEQLRRVESQFPIASQGGWDLQAFRGPYGYPTPFSWQVIDVLLRLRESAQARSSGTKPYVYALTNPKDYQLQGMGLAHVGVSDISSGWNEQGPGATGPWRNVMVHELGHAFGLDHDLGSPSGASWGFQKDLCGTVSTPTMTHPGWTGRAVFNAPDGGGTPPLVMLPTISDFNTSAGRASRTHEGLVLEGVSRNPASVFEEYWGVDTRYVGTSGFALAYSDPRKTGELMSYVNAGGSRCRLDADSEGQGYWVSPQTYEYLRDNLIPADSTRILAPGDQVIISMSSDADGTIADIGPMIDVPYIDTGRSNDLGYALFLYDGAGGLIGEATPDVSFAANEGEDDTTYGFLVADFPQQEVARMDLVRDGVVIASNSASSATPVVEITGPPEGAILAGEVIELAWTSSDADGDALEFDVMYSPDGLDWDALKMGLTGDGVSIDRSLIAGSAAGQFLVVVNDGFNSSTDTVGGLAVAGNSPWLLIGDPIDGSTYAGNTQIPFAAWVSDREDGSIGFAEVSWVSNLDGALDVSSDAGVRASDLTEGVHSVTATVADSDGNATTATATMTIRRDDPSQPAAPGTRPLSGAVGAEPGPSASVGPQPSPSSGVDETPGTEPSPTPSSSPTLTASGPSEPGSGAWVWWLGLAVLVSAAAVGALWSLLRRS